MSTLRGLHGLESRGTQREERTALRAAASWREGLPDLDARPQVQTSFRLPSVPKIIRRRYPALFVTDLVGDLLAFGLVALTVGVEPVLAGVVATGAIGLWLAFGLYRRRFVLSVLDQLPRLAAGVAVAASVAWWVGYPGISMPSPGRLGFYAAAALAGVVAVRTAMYAVARSMRRSGRAGHRTVILGAGEVGATLARRMQEHPEYGLVPMGFLDSDPLVHELPVPMLGGPDDLARVIHEFDVATVVVAFSAVPESTLVHVLRTANRESCEILFVPRLFEMHGLMSSKDVEEVWGIPLVRIRRSPHRTFGWHLKRVVDAAVAGTALVLLAPVLAAVALAVRLDGGPGVLFRQERVGLDGRRITVLKFRSLRPADPTESQTTWNVAQDQRMSRIGRVIRKTSLDELPQLLNIVKGDMSLVGPRPERPYFVERFTKQYAGYADRHRVPVGLTGLSQVRGLRGDTSIADRAYFDNAYIEGWSLWSDVKIALRTVATVFRGTGS